MDYQSVLSEIETWPIDDRIRLVHEVWDRLADQGYQPDLTEELRAEFDCRIDEMDRNPAAGTAWEVAKDRVLGRLQK